MTGTVAIALAAAALGGGPRPGWPRRRGATALRASRRGLRATSLARAERLMARALAAP